MHHENFFIKIEGMEVPDIYQDIIFLEIESGEELAALFKLQIAIMKKEDGTWSYLDNERFTVWKRLAILAGFDSGPEEIISGYITHVKPSFDPDPSQCIVEIWGMDASVLMDREEKLKDWPNKKDSDIASEIFGLYGFTPCVDNTSIVHDEAISTIIQRETDMQFLKRLAFRNGFECYVEGSTGYFRKPQLDAPPQPVLAMHFGDETNLKRFSIETNALTPADVTMFQLDQGSKEILTVTVEESQQKILGAFNGKNLHRPGMNPGKIYVGMNTTTGNPEMTGLCSGMFHQAGWFISGEGEICSNHYGHVLRPRRTVTIKGVGETYSGIYYVDHVTHSFTSDGYIQIFKVKRNAVKPTGTEKFSTSPKASEPIVIVAPPIGDFS